MEPRIQYAKTSDGVSIAYYAIGQGPAAAGQRQRKDYRPVPKAPGCLGDNREQAPDLLGAQPPWRSGTHPGPLDLVAGVRGNDLHSDQEAEEGAYTSQPGADRDCRWLPG